MIEWTAKSFLIDETAVVLVICLTLLAFLIVKNTIDNPVIVGLSLPSFYFATLWSNYLFREYGFALTADKVMNLAFACGVGFIAAFLALVALYWISTAVFSR